MRIIHVVNVRWFNATAWYGVFLARLMAEAGHEVMILALPSTPPGEKARELGLTVRELPLNSNNPATIARLFFQLNTIIRTFRPHVVNCHRGEGFILWGLLKRLRRDFLLIRTRGDQRLPRNNLFNRWLHCRVADAVIATNSLTRDVFLREMGVPAERVRLIPGGVDTGAFAFTPQGRERIRSEYGFSEGHFVIGLLGRFDRVKGQKELIRAVSTLVREQGLDQIRLLLIGFPTATSTGEVKAWIREAGIGHITAITGKCPDVAPVLSALDLGVVPSLWSEAIARAALELMACQRVVIGSRVGVMTDLFSDEALCEPGDVDQLAARIARCMADPLLMERLAADQARRMESLSHHDFLDQTMVLVNELAATD